MFLFSVFYLGFSQDLQNFERLSISTRHFGSPEKRRREAAKQPIICGTKFEPGKMSVTLAFNVRNLTAKHASLFFERHNADGSKYEYSGIHLCGASESSGSGGDARVEKIGDSEKVLQAVNGKFTPGKQESRLCWTRENPHYDCLASFVVDDNMDEILRKVDDDAKGIQFSLLADLWDRNTYNCCSYAHRVLSYCGIYIPYESTRGSVPFVSTKNDNGFIQATIKYCQEQKDKLHAIAKEKCDTLFAHDTRVAATESVGRVAIGGGIGAFIGSILEQMFPAKSEEEREEAVKKCVISGGLIGAIVGFLYDLYVKDCENYRSKAAKRCLPLEG